VKPSYARVVLHRIEESLTKNTPIDLSETTVEHIMPQSLSPWWQEHLGGDDAAQEVHSKYLDTIGNLALVSRAYNSRMSNRSWPTKVDSLKDVQFSITNSIAPSSMWNEEVIKDRNEYLANLACKAITGPVKRTIPYRTYKPSDSFDEGTYSFTDLTTPMDGTTG
jgi:hypothetical protein